MADCSTCSTAGAWRDVGIEIVKAAAVYGNRLSGNAYKVLVAMSVSALDKPSNGRPASLYWGGWDSLALTLGHEDATRNSSGHKAVKRAIKELRDGQHISPMTTAARGSRQSYMVHPGGLKGDQNGPVKGGQSDPVKGGQNGPQSGVELSPPRKEQGTKGQNKDTSLTRQGQPQEAVGQEVEPHGFKGRPGEDCEECGRSRLNQRIHPLRLVRGGTR